jgi:hypothetical protein
MKSKLFVIALATAVTASHFTRGLRGTYPAIESYALRPGIVASPRYGHGGALCEVSFEKRRIQPDSVDLDTTMPRELVLKLVDELASPTERGKSSSGIKGFDYLDHINGESAIAVADYENVTVQIYRDRSVHGDAAATVIWKNVCGGWPRPSNHQHRPQE